MRPGGASQSSAPVMRHRRIPVGGCRVGGREASGASAASEPAGASPQEAVVIHRKKFSTAEKFNFYLTSISGGVLMNCNRLQRAKTYQVGDFLLRNGRVVSYEMGVDFLSNGRWGFG